MFGEIAFRLPGAYNNKTFSFNSLFLTSLAPNQILYSNANNQILSLGALTNGQLFIGSTGSAPIAATLTAGSGVSIANASGSITISATGSGGTVTSFSSGNLSPLFTTSVANPTTTPALSFSLSTAGANTYFGNATGSSAAPSYTAAGALTKTDDTNVTLTLGGSPTVSLLAATSLTLGWTGTLSGARGGTGVNNGSSTITIGGNVTFSGAFTSTFTFTGNTNVTFPTSGTLATTSGTVSSITGTANQITASASTGAVTLSFPSVLHSTNGTVLDDGSANMSLVSGKALFVDNIQGTSTDLRINPSASGQNIYLGHNLASTIVTIGAGSTATDFSVVNATPTTLLHVANTGAVTTKNNTLDNGTTGAASFSGPVTLPGNATSALQAVPLQQISSIVGGNVWADFYCISRCGGL